MDDAKNLVDEVAPLKEAVAALDPYGLVDSGFCRSPHNLSLLVWAS